MVVRLAGQKAREVADRVGPNRWVLGVDTVVAIDDHILGKPTDEAHATQMLLQLSDRTHSVYSGFAVVGFGEEHTGIDETRVTMRSITLVEAAAYSATGEPLDKAGAYAIQGEAIRFITAGEGSRLNVAGLPLEHATLVEWVGQPLETLLPLLADRGIRSGSVATDTSDAIAP